MSCRLFCDVSSSEGFVIYCTPAAGLDSSRAAASESSTPAHAHGQDQVFSLAETARLFHRDNKGSTAATFGGSTNFGGSDAGTGAALSSRSIQCRGAACMDRLKELQGPEPCQGGYAPPALAKQIL